MKKAFIEPEMQRIEIDLRENIAASVQAGIGYYFYVTLFSCTIMETGKYVGQVSESEAAGCLISMAGRSIGTIVPVAEVRPHFQN